MRKYLKILLTTMVLFLTGMRVVFADSPFTITFHSGSGGEFEDGSTENVMVINSSEHYVKYSHTANVDDTGLKLSNYGNSWTNANITGTDRGDTSKAHVVKIDGAESLTVDLYFNGESTSYDWVSVFAGEYPNYTAASNYNSTGAVTTAMGAPNATNRFGGGWSGTYTVNGNTLTNVGHVTLTIPGDAVTFAFRSDGSGAGQGYGYYAIVSYSNVDVASGEYKEPVGHTVGSDEYIFKEWHDNPSLTGDPVDPFTITSDTDLYAEYEEDVIAKGTYGCAWKIKSDGTLVIGNPGETCTLTSNPNVTEWPWYGNKNSVSSVKFNGTVNARNEINGMFYNFNNLLSIDFTGFNTENVTSMGSLFSGCTKLTNLDLSGFNTGNVQNMNGMFHNCSQLTSLNLSSFDTRNVVNMDSMFSHCQKLPAVDISNFNTEKVTNMLYMFNACESLTALDLSNFNTEKVTVMAGMFDACGSLQSIDLSSFNTNNVTSMREMFKGCSKLTNLDVSNFNTEKVTDMKGMFYDCESLTDLDISSFDTKNVTTMEEMFFACKKIQNLDLSNFNTEKVTTMAGMFYICESLTNIELLAFDTKNVTVMTDMFRRCSALTTLNLSGFDTKKVTSMASMFENCTNLSSLNITGFNTEKVQSMSGMFRGCSSLANLDVSGFNTENVTYLANMFMGCSSLTGLDVSNFDFKKITSLEYMFSGCRSLTNLSFSGLNTDNIQNLNYTFDNCSSLTSLDLSGLNTNSVTRMDRTFYGCSSLTNLNLSNFNTSNVTTMGGVFGNCSNLSAILLPDTFSFSGKNILGENGKALLPTPKSPSTGWKRIYDSNNMTRDNSGTVYTAVELRDNWNPSEMAGLWVWNELDMSSSGFGDDTKMSSVDPKWVQLDTTTWKYTFNVFDDSLDYYVTEGILPGFNSDIPADPGYIQTQNKEAHITNTSTTETGSLTLTKNVTGNPGVFDKFTFIITLSGQGIGGTQVIDGVVFKDGVGKVQLSRGQSKTLNGLVEGVTYSVVEEPMDGYESTGINTEGTIIKEGSLVVFNNSYIYDTTFDPDDELDDPTTGGFVLSKKVEDPYDIAQEEFGYIIELRGLVANKNYSYSKEVADDNYSTVPFSADSSGTATVDLNLKDGRKVYFSELPINSEFRITELGGNYYPSYEISGTGAVIKDNDRVSSKNTNLSTEYEKVDPEDAEHYINVDFTNTYEEFRNLLIAKQIAQDTDARFEFTVSLDGLKPNSTYNSSIGRIVADDDGEAEKTFYLSKGQTVTIEGLPVGSQYTVTESPSVFVASYEIEGDGSDANTLPNTALSTGAHTIGTTNANVTFTNSVETSTLSLTKTVEDGEPEDLTEDFEFTIALKNGEDTAESKAMPVTGTFDYTGSKTGSITFNNAGIGTVTLKHGETITINNIPVGSVYTVSEAQYEDFTTSSTGASGKILSGGLSAASFTNKKLAKSQLTISKTVSGNLGDKSKNFRFTVELIDKDNNPINGTYPYTGSRTGTLTFADGTAELFLKHGESITITDLKVKTKYTVTEDNYGADGYSTVYEDATGTIVKDGNTASFENINSAIVPSGLYINRNTIALGSLGMISLIAFIVLRMTKLRKLSN